MSPRKIAIAAGIVVLLFGGIYLLFFRSSTDTAAPEQTLTTQVQSDGSLPFGAPPADNANSSGDTATENINGTDFTSNTKSTSRPSQSQSESAEVTKISKGDDGIVAVSGGVIFLQGKQERVRFAERGTSHIYEIAPDGSGGSRITNTTIPRVTESRFTADGSGVYLRYLDDSLKAIRTYSAKIATTTGTTGAGGSLKGTFLAENISDLAIAQDSVFTLSEEPGGANGSLVKQDGSKKTVLWTSPLREWLAEWPNENLLALTTKASASVPGMLVFVNAKTGKESRILRGMTLLTETNPTGEYVLNLQSVDGKLGLYIYDIKNDLQNEISFTTLPEKCAWGTAESYAVYCAVPDKMNGVLPDAWYQGAVSFSDSFWKVNARTGATSLLAESQNLPEVVDGTHLMIAPKEDYLIFTNKRDLTLWSLKLN